MRTAHALIPTALVAVLLSAGCSSDTAEPEATESAQTACVESGDASDAVEVTGDFGGELTLASETPLSASSMQRTVLIEGDGETLEDGASITATVTMINGTSGEVTETYADTSLTNSEDSLVDWAYEAVRCSVVGQRVAMVDTASNVFAESYTTYGYEANDAVVIIFDITAAEPGTLNEDDLPTKAEGTAQAAPDGYPTVSLAENGEPTITIPEGTTAPTDLKIATLIKGEGEEVKDGDRVYVQYKGVLWSSGEEFDSTWAADSPTNFVTTEVIGGFEDALVGQKVGSQVIAVVPADEDKGGYGAEQLETMGYAADEVMVFVLDVLGTVHPES